MIKKLTSYRHYQNSATSFHNFWIKELSSKTKNEYKVPDPKFVSTQEELLQMRRNLAKEYFQLYRLVENYNKAFIFDLKMANESFDYTKIEFLITLYFSSHPGEVSDEIYLVLVNLFHSYSIPQKKERFLYHIGLVDQLFEMLSDFENSIGKLTELVRQILTLVNKMESPFRLVELAKKWINFLPQNEETYSVLLECKKHLNPSIKNEANEIISFFWG